MAKRNLPAQPAPRVIHYLDPVNPTGVVPLSEQELAVKRRQDQILYARWLERRAELAERDRKARRFWIGFGATFGLGLLAGLGALVWAIASAGVGLMLAVPAVLLLLGGLAIGGHKCVTVVQHWH